MNDAVPAHRDLALAERCRAGVPGAFEEVYRTHAPRLFGLACRMVGRPEAEDLLQEIFLSAHRKLALYKGESSLGTWLYRIAVNVSLNRVSAKSPRFEPLARAGVEGSAEAPDSAVLRQERQAVLRAAIARLPKKQRATLILRLYHDLRHEEIAAILGGSVGAAKANLFHALANLRKLLT